MKKIISKKKNSSSTKKKISSSMITKNSTIIKNTLPNFIRYICQLDVKREYWGLNVYFEKLFLKKFAKIKYGDIKNYMRLFLARPVVDCTINDPLMKQIETLIDEDLKKITFPITEKIKGKRFTLNWKKIHFDFDNFLFWILFSKLPDSWINDDKYNIFLEFFTIQKVLLILLTNDTKDLVVLNFYYKLLSVNLINLHKKISKLCYYQT